MELRATRSIRDQIGVRAGSQNNLGLEANCNVVLVNNVGRHLRVLSGEVKYSYMF